MEKASKDSVKVEITPQKSKPCNGGEENCRQTGLRHRRSYHPQLLHPMPMEKSHGNTANRFFSRTEKQGGLEGCYCPYPPRKVRKASRGATQGQAKRRIVYGRAESHHPQPGYKPGSVRSS
jgi:hypothetical protein